MTDGAEQLDDEDVSALKEMAEWWRESGMSRRAVLGLAGGATLGAASAGGFLTGRASAQTSAAGDIGGPDNPANAHLVDVFDYNGNTAMSFPGDGSVNIDSASINDNELFIQGSEPSSPSAGDIWIDNDG